MKKSRKKADDWRKQTLEQLENEIWPTVFDVSFMISTCHNLRKKPIHQFDVEDLRLMISQKIGIAFLIPEALRKLDKNLFLEGHLYPGDLFEAVLSAGLNYWFAHQDNVEWLILIADKNEPRLKKKYPQLYESYQEWVQQVTAN